MRRNTTHIEEWEHNGTYRRKRNATRHSERKGMSTLQTMLIKIPLKHLQMPFTVKISNETFSAPLKK
jgi:hypothetical protein